MVGAGFYHYSDGAATGEWEGLAALVPGRGNRVAVADEIVERCMKALHAKVCELVGAGVAPDEALKVGSLASPEEARAPRTAPRATPASTSIEAPTRKVLLLKKLVVPFSAFIDRFRCSDGGTDTR